VSPRVVLEEETHSWKQGTIIKETSANFLSHNPGRELEQDMEPRVVVSLGLFGRPVYGREGAMSGCKVYTAMESSPANYFAHICLW
jgi:hypothetical protein